MELTDDFSMSVRAGALRQRSHLQVFRRRDQPGRLKTVRRHGRVLLAQQLDGQRLDVEEQNVALGVCNKKRHCNPGKYGSGKSQYLWD